MTLTREQRDAIDQGNPVPIVVDGQRCVPLRADLYVRPHADDDSRPTYPAVLRALDRDDDDPDQYLEYLNESG